MRRRNEPTCVTAGLLVCTGKDCRGDKGFVDMVTLAADAARSHEVPCQGLCNGPVVGMHVEGELRWFSKMRSAKRRALVDTMLHTGKVPRQLRDHEARKHRGEIRGSRRLHPLDHHRARTLSAP